MKSDKTKKPAAVVDTYKVNPTSKKYLPRVEVFDFGFEADRNKFAWIHSNPYILVGSETGTFDKTGNYHLVSFIEIEVDKYKEVCKKLSQTEFEPAEFMPKTERTAGDKKATENKTEQETGKSIKLDETDIVDDVD